MAKEKFKNFKIKKKKKKKKKTEKIKNKKDFKKIMDKITTHLIQMRTILMKAKKTYFKET